MAEFYPAFVLSMREPLQKLVAWLLVAQVALVGALGTGLHDLLGCQHGVCVIERDPASQCECCGTCGKSAEPSAPLAEPNSGAASPDKGLTVTAAECGECALCDLLDQFHQAAPAWDASIDAEVIVSQTNAARENSVVAAAIRLALSRGPPAV